MIEPDQIIEGDCLRVMAGIADKSVDMVLCDLPYGNTANHWDTVIPFHLLWEQYRRITKENSAIVLTATQPFATDLINSARDLFRYDMVWHKTNPVGFFNANKMPMRAHELILVFYAHLPTFNPIGGHCHPSVRKRCDPDGAGGNYSHGKTTLTDVKNNGMRKPTSVIKIKNDDYAGHSTQKPVALFQYLIETYTNEGDLVLDNCIGSGTTAVACQKSGRHFIGIEKEEKYCEIARKRIAALPARLDNWLSIVVPHSPQK